MGGPGSAAAAASNQPNNSLRTNQPNLNDMGAKLPWPQSLRPPTQPKEAMPLSPPLTPLPATIGKNQRLTYTRYA